MSEVNPETKELPPSLVGKSQAAFVASLGLAYERVSDWFDGEKAFRGAGDMIGLKEASVEPLWRTFSDEDARHQAYNRVTTMFRPWVVLSRVAAYREQVVEIDFMPRDQLEEERISELSPRDRAIRNASRAFPGIWKEVRKTFYTSEDLENYGSRFLKPGAQGKKLPGNVNDAVRTLDSLESAMREPAKIQQFGGLVIIGAIADLYYAELALRFK